MNTAIGLIQDTIKEIKFLNTIIVFFNELEIKINNKKR